MRKSYIFLALIFLSQLFNSCSNVFSDYETITFLFPPWPPEQTISTDREYPELSCWFVEIETPEISRQFFTTEKQISLELKKNIPAGITVTPVTKHFINNKIIESSSFYPAGICYPYCIKSNHSEPQKLRWEEGFCANLLQRIYRTTEETGITQEHIENFQKSFNWKKCQETIDSKIAQAINAESQKLYNPWQIDSNQLLENLCYASFSANLLTIKNSYSINLEEIDISKNNILSPYIPENLFIEKTNQICIQKNATEFYLYNNNLTAKINCISSKKLSVDLCYLPIFYKDYDCKQENNNNTFINNSLSFCDICKK